MTDSSKDPDGLADLLSSWVDEAFGRLGYSATESELVAYILHRHGEEARSDPRLLQEIDPAAAIELILRNRAPDGSLTQSEQEIVEQLRAKQTREELEDEVKAADPSSIKH